MASTPNERVKERINPFIPMAITIFPTYLEVVQPTFRSNKHPFLSNAYIQIFKVPNDTNSLLYAYIPVCILIFLKTFFIPHLLSFILSFLSTFLVQIQLRRMEGKQR